MSEIPPKEAAELILARRAPAGLRTGVLHLPLAETKKPVTLPPSLHCYALSLVGQPIAVLPPDLRVEYKLDLTDCHQLTGLPANLRVSTLVLANCGRLTGLPEGLQVNFLQLDGCAALRHWPHSARVVNGWVRARGCSALEQLPASLGPVASLDLRGCGRISSISPDTKVCSWIDIGGTRITSLPETLRGIGLRWRGVPVTPQIAFFPETLNGPDVLAERNTELRRVMIERVGFEKFLQEVKAEVLDADRDRGGQRKLLRVPLTNDEPIVLVSVHCPSTGRQYLVRVPPDTRTCRAAVAWTAGFDNPNDYAPIEET
ncbi:MAG: hypothetical protein L0Z50_41590 [Verrucomicrobiales bacterium]|nr:hypothetical protein [Verrucomicrobiales bacterium]